MRRILAFVALLAAALPAQAGSHRLYGCPCRGTGDAPGAPCIVMNPTGAFTPVLVATNAPLWAIQADTGASPCVVTGFELQMKTTKTGPVWVRTWLFGEAGGKPAQALRAGILVVDVALGWYRTAFAPLALPASTTFFLAYEPRSGTSLTPPAMSAGTMNNFFLGQEGGPWAGPVNRYAWSYKVNVGTASGGGWPLLTVDSMPAAGKVYTAELSYAPTGSLALYLMGVSDTAWGGVPLPLDLTGLGAPGCHLNLALGLAFFLPVLPGGVGAYRVPVPNDPALLGGTFYHQFLVADRGANGLGVTLSNGGRGSIGV